MDELEIKGKKYISSKRASQLTGYAKDYIGQLARSGKIVGTRMGRAWYVEEGSLLVHAKNDLIENAPVSTPERVVSPIQPRILTPRTFASSQASFPSSWSPTRYSSDDSELMLKPIKEVPVPSAQISIEPPLDPSGFDQAPSKELETAIRIKILEERVPRQVLQRSTTKFRIAEKANGINKKRRSKKHIIALGALSAALVVFVFFSSGFFLSSNIEFIGPEKAYTANVLAGSQYFKDVLGALPMFTQGLQALQDFFLTLSSSFSEFFSKGVQFLFSFFQRII